MENKEIANKEIVNIGIGRIHPHPQNPRKDLGDLTELVESIKKNGIMQNLTVIPIEGEPGEYTAIIGHRRHAAAKLAGVTDAPCRIAKGLDAKEQVSTMLEENMQRHDLTIYEQAQGFQMMLDLGETEETIAKKTGFGRTTIRHRLNIAKLDQTELKKKEQDGNFQLTLKDLCELEKVADVSARNKILREAANSRELAWKAQSAAQDAKRAKNTKQVVGMLKKIGVEEAPEKAGSEQYSGKWNVVKEIDLDKDVPKRISLKETGSIYYLPYYRSVRIIKRAKKEKKILTPEEAQRKQRERDKKAIKARLKEMDANRKEFIQNIVSGKIDAVKDENEIREKAWRFLIEAGGFLSPSRMMGFYIEKPEYECTAEERAEALKKIGGLGFTHSMLIAMHTSIVNIGDICDWQGCYKPETGKALMHAYEALKPYGWTFASDDDEPLLSGTHELYSKERKV